MVQIIDCTSRPNWIFTFHYDQEGNLTKINEWEITEPTWKILLPPDYVVHSKFYLAHKIGTRQNPITHEQEQYEYLEREWIFAGQPSTYEEKWIANFGVKHPDSDLPTEPYNVYPLITTQISEPEGLKLLGKKGTKK